MHTVYNVIYRDLRATWIYRASARRTKAQADRLADTLRKRGCEVTIDDQQPADGAPLNAPIVDVGAVLAAERKARR